MRAITSILRKVFTNRNSGRDAKPAIPLGNNGMSIYQPLVGQAVHVCQGFVGNIESIEGDTVLVSGELYRGACRETWQLCYSYREAKSRARLWTARESHIVWDYGCLKASTVNDIKVPCASA